MRKNVTSILVGVLYFIFIIFGPLAVGLFSQRAAKSTEEPKTATFFGVAASGTIRSSLDFFHIEASQKIVFSETAPTDTVICWKNVCKRLEELFATPIQIQNWGWKLNKVPAIDTR